MVAEKYHTHAPDCPNQLHPPVRPEEGEMFTAREQKGDGVRRRSPRRRVAMATPKVNTRFAQVTRSTRRRRNPSKGEEDAPPSLELTPKSSRTPSMSVVTAPLEGALRWDEEESDVSHVLSPVARPSTSHHDAPLNECCIAPCHCSRKRSDGIEGDVAK